MIKVVNTSVDAKHKPLEFQIIDDRSSRSKFESLILHVQITDPTAGIRSQWLDQLHLMLQ